jgi:hypothetical protein
MSKLLIAVAILLLTSCTYVGVKLKPGTEGLCAKSTAVCVHQDKNFAIEYTVTEAGNGYEVSGEAIPVDGNTKTFSTFSGASFTLFLIDNNVVVDEIGIAGGTGSLDSKITFKRTFTGKKFDTTALGYSMNVKG